MIERTRFVSLTRDELDLILQAFTFTVEHLPDETVLDPAVEALIERLEKLQEPV